MIKRYTRPEAGRIWKDQNRFETYLRIELFACEAQAKEGSIPKKALAKIKKQARFNLKRIDALEKKTHHDLLAFVNNVAENIGKESQYFHCGLTSTDIVDTAFSSLMKESIELLIKDLETLIKAVASRARRYKNTIMTGRTHGVHAEPTTFGLKLALFYTELKRDLVRLKAAREIISVGKLSGAVGTYANLSPAVEKYVCQKMGLKASPISSQVLQRDRHAEYLSAIAICGATLEKIALEFRHLQRTEVRELEEPFGKGQKGSSAMPHKKNPVMCERVCGLARILRGNSNVALQNVALWHERDISHSSVERIIIPDSVILLDYMLNLMVNIVKNATVYPENMKKNLESTGGLIYSSKVLVKLMEAGLPRTKAYDIVQKLSMKVWKDKVNLKNLLVKDKEVSSLLSKAAINKIFQPASYLKHINRIFKRIGL